MLVAQCIAEEAVGNRSVRRRKVGNTENAMTNNDASGRPNAPA